MKIVILSASPKKEASLTLQTGRLIQKVSEFSFGFKLIPIPFELFIFYFHFFSNYLKKLINY